METKTLSEYEDIYQEFLADVLLKDLVDKKNIRPTRQKQFNPLQVPNPDYNDSKEPSKTNRRFVALQPEDTLVLFFMRHDRGGTRPYVESPTKSYHIRVWDVDIAVYGENANQIINTIKQGQSLDKALRYLNQNNLALGDWQRNINTTDLLINSQWYKQRRYNCTYHETVETNLDNLSVDRIENVGSVNLNKGEE